MQFNIPDAPKVYTKNLLNFRGVDFTSISPDIKRASNMINLVNNNGYLETRQGYDSVGYNFGENNMNGIWNIDQDGTEVFIAHVGTKLYKLDSDFSNPVDISLTEAMSDVRTQYSSAYLNDHLLIFDGNRTIIYGYISSSWQAAYLDTIGYVPTTNIGRSPEGTTTTAYEDVNLMQSYRINNFLPDGVSAVYTLDSSFDDEEPTATILQSDGTIASLTILSYDKDKGTVTFDSVPPESPVEGRDSVYIRFKVTNTEHKKYINGCNIVTVYGYNGNKNRLFVAGNTEYPNVDWHSQYDDPTYFPDTAYTTMGTQPIVNYITLNDGSLATLKKVSDTDSTIYYRESALYSGKEVFPVGRGVKTLGCISKYANGNLLNDPLILTEIGVYALNGSEYNEKFSSERSYFVKKRLIEENNLENAVAIVHKGKYYLAVNDHVYVADSRYKSYINQTQNSDYQYEWYYWNNVPVRIWFTYNSELYFGTENGLIVKFNDTVYDYDKPIQQLFDTTFLELGSILNAKTIRRISVVSRPFEDTQFTLSYVLSDDVNNISSDANDTNDFPHILQEKEKIKKFMFVKLRLSSDVAKKMNFYQIGIEYVYAGHYRG